MSNVPIEVLAVALDPIPCKPLIRALCDIQYGEIRLAGCRLFGDPGRERLNFPDSLVCGPCRDPACGAAVPLIHAFCGQCGARQPYREPALKPNGKKRLFHQVAHPVAHACRLAFEEAAHAAHERARAAKAAPDGPRLFLREGA